MRRRHRPHQNLKLNRLLHRSLPKQQPANRRRHQQLALHRPKKAFLAGSRTCLRCPKHPPLRLLPMLQCQQSKLATHGAMAEPTHAANAAIVVASALAVMVAALAAAAATAVVNAVPNAVRNAMASVVKHVLMAARKVEATKLAVKAVEMKLAATNAVIVPLKLLRARNAANALPLTLYAPRVAKAANRVKQESRVRDVKYASRVNLANRVPRAAVAAANVASALTGRNATLQSRTWPWPIRPRWQPHRAASRPLDSDRKGQQLSPAASRAQKAAATAVTAMAAAMKLSPMTPPKVITHRLRPATALPKAQLALQRMEMPYRVMSIRPLTRQDCQALTRPSTPRANLASAAAATAMAVIAAIATKVVEKTASRVSQTNSLERLVLPTPATLSI